MSTDQGALRARYRNLLNDLLLAAILRRYWIFNGYLGGGVLVPGLAIYMINHGERGDALALLMLYLASWLCIGCAWLLLGRAAHAGLIQAAYGMVGAQLTQHLRDSFAARLKGEHPKPMFIREVAQATRELIATAGPRALEKAARWEQRVAEQRDAVDQHIVSQDNA
ncbi:MAG: hypothetical protein ACRCY3_14210 [Sphingorhabdus sp.]